MPVKISQLLPMASTPLNSIKLPQLPKSIEELEEEEKQKRAAELALIPEAYDLTKKYASADR